MLLLSRNIAKSPPQKSSARYPGSATLVGNFVKINFEKEAVRREAVAKPKGVIKKDMKGKTWKERQKGRKQKSVKRLETQLHLQFRAAATVALQPPPAEEGHR